MPIRSGLRTVVLRPRPRHGYGVSVAEDAPTWPQASPDDELDYTCDIRHWLEDIAPDTVRTAQVNVAPSGSSDLMVTTATLDESMLTVWLSGGVIGTLYQVKWDILTEQFRRHSAIVLLPVGTQPLRLVPARASAVTLMQPAFGTPTPATLVTD